MNARDMAPQVSDELRVIGDVDGPRVIDVTEAVIEAETPRATVGKGTLHRYKLIGALLALIDIMCLAVALFAAHVLRFGFLPGRKYMIGMVAASVLWVGVFRSLGLYAPHHLSRLEEFRRTVSAVAIGIVLVILLTFWLDVYLSRSWVAITLIIALVLEVTARTVAGVYVSRLHSRQSLVLRTLVVGEGERAAGLIKTLEVRGSGFLPLGYIESTNPLIASEVVSPIERVKHLREVLRQYELDCIFVASPTIGTSQMLALMQAARQEGVLVHVYTHLPGILASRVTVQAIAKEGMALTLRPARLSRFQRAVKRGIDLVLASAGLALASPFLLIIALAIKCTSRGPVLFRQERVTEAGRIFRIYKFRTMTNDADRRFKEQAIDTSAPFFKLRTDPPLTRVGNWLRRWSIDEVPQLLNVLLGDMSLVGPRPLPAEQVSAHVELLGPRHEVRAGVTGWWQIQGRADLGPEEAIRMDHFYIENWSPALDLYILLRTAGVLLTRKGAF